MSRQWVRLTVAASTEEHQYDMLVREEDVLDVRATETKHGPTRIKLRVPAENVLMAANWEWFTVTQPIAEVHRRLIEARESH